MVTFYVMVIFKINMKIFTFIPNIVTSSLARLIYYQYKQTSFVYFGEFTLCWAVDVFYVLWRDHGNTFVNTVLFENI